MNYFTVPWANWEEWESVAMSLEKVSTTICNHRALFLRKEFHTPAENGEREVFLRDVAPHLWAYKRVKAWETRAAVPLAIQTSAALSNILISSQQALISNSSIRLSLIQSIIRFVNGVLDSGQNGTKAVSLKLIATRFGFPLALVEIRHAATHNKLPSLETTKHATFKVLQYINQNYFEQQRELLSNSKQKIENLLKDYKSQKEKLILLTEQSKTASDDLKESIEKDIKAIEAICSTPEKVITDLLPLLFSEVFLIPETSIPVSDSLPQELYQVWYQLLKSLSKSLPHFAPLSIVFVSQLVVKTELDINDSNETGKLTAFFYDDSKKNRLSLLCHWHLLLIQLIGKKRIGSVSLMNGGVFEMAIKAIVGLCPPNSGKCIESIFTNTMQLLKDEEKIKYIKMRKEFTQADLQLKQEEKQNVHDKIKVVRVPRSLSAGMNLHGVVGDLTLPDDLEGNFFVLKEKKKVTSTPHTSSPRKITPSSAANEGKVTKTTKRVNPSAQLVKKAAKPQLQQEKQKKAERSQQQEQQVQQREEKQLKEDCLSTFEMLNDLLM